MKNEKIEKIAEEIRSGNYLIVNNLNIVFKIRSATAGLKVIYIIVIIYLLV